MSGHAAKQKHRLSRAATLLAKVVDSGSFDADRLARELVVSPRRVEAYISGAVAMPMDRQIVLAKFLIDNAPRFARTARSLLKQIEAAIAYANSETVTHSTAPLSTKHFF